MNNSNDICEILAYIKKGWQDWKQYKKEEQDRQNSYLENKLDESSKNDDKKEDSNLKQ